MMRPRRGLHGSLVEDLGRRIVRGDIGPGSTIVPAELGDAYGVSRTVVREALRVLESKGLVSARQNVGTRPLPSTSWDMLDADVVAWRLESEDGAEASRQVLELRSAIEPLAARLCAERADDAQRGALRECIERMVLAAEAGDHAETVRADVDLHAAIFQAADNVMLARLESVVGAALQARRVQIAERGFSTISLAKHVELVDSIVAGRGDEAAATMADIVAQTAASIR